MRKENYEVPQMEVILFEEKDIITTSGIDEGEGDLGGL